MDSRKGFRHEPNDYFEGRKARSQGRKKQFCQYSNTVKKHWWLAGWHDKDMELDQK